MLKIERELKPTIIGYDSRVKLDVVFGVNVQNNPPQSRDGSLEDCVACLERMSCDNVGTKHIVLPFNLRTSEQIEGSYKGPFKLRPYQYKFVPVLLTDGDAVMLVDDRGNIRYANFVKRSPVSFEIAAYSETGFIRETFEVSL